MVSRSGDYQRKRAERYREKLCREMGELLGTGKPVEFFPGMTRVWCMLCWLPYNGVTLENIRQPQSRHRLLGMPNVGKATISRLGKVLFGEQGWPEERGQPVLPPIKPLDRAVFNSLSGKAAICLLYAEGVILQREVARCFDYTSATISTAVVDFIGRWLPDLDDVPDWRRQYDMRPLWAKKAVENYFAVFPSAKVEVEKIEDQIKALILPRQAREGDTQRAHAVMAKIGAWTSEDPPDWDTPILTANEAYALYRLTRASRSGP